MSSDKLLTLIYDKLVSMENEILSVKDELAVVKSTVTRIEINHGDKLAALKDGWLQHEDRLSDQQKEVREQFDDIRTDTRYLVRRVSSLEKLVK